MHSIGPPHSTRIGTHNGGSRASHGSEPLTYRNGRVSVNELRGWYWGAAAKAARSGRFWSTVVDMPGSKRPTPEDAMSARRVLLGGLARDADVDELAGELAPLHPRNDTFPGEVLLRLAADALDWCGASRAEPLPLEGLRDRFLPEATFRGRERAKLQYAVLAVAAIHGGTEPDLLDEVAWWQTDDFWQYALYAAVAYIRAAAARAGVLVSQACQDLDERQDHPAHSADYSRCGDGPGRGCSDGADQLGYGSGRGS
jgi:hypothetical protein